MDVLIYIIQNLAQLDEIADVIIVDTGAGISEAVLEFLVASGEILLVTTPEPTSITDSYSLLKALARHPRYSKEETKSSKNDIAYDMEDSVVTEAPAHNQSAKDEAEIMEDVSAEEPALDDAPAEETTEAIDNSVTGSDGENGDIPNATDQVTITDERIIRVYGYFIAYDDKITIRITSVASNEYEEFDVGVDTEITLSNPWMLETLSIDWTYFEAEAYFDSLSIDDNGEYVARLSDFNWIEKTSK